MAGWTTKLVLLDCSVVKKGLPGNGEAFLLFWRRLVVTFRIIWLRIVSAIWHPGNESGGGNRMGEAAIARTCRRARP